MKIFFRALPWSHGTLGFMVSCKLKIIPSTNYVELKYQPFFSKEEFLKSFEEISHDPNGPLFVEGISFSENTAVLMTGNLIDKIDENNGKLNPIGRWYKPWFYSHVEELLNRKSPVIEYIPLRDYYHRHTRSLFWEMQHILPFGNDPLFRFFMGWMLPLKVSLLKITQTQATEKLFREKFIFQDMLVPMGVLDKTIQFFDQNYEVYPLWLCPHKVFNTGKYQGFLKPSKHVSDFEMFVDVGAYGPPRKKFNHLIDMPKMEKFVRDLKGYQALYAHTYMNSQEFREMFDHTLYDQMRKTLNAQKAFPEVFVKVFGKAKQTK